MDNSQSSNVFSDGEVLTCDSSVEAMETVSYENLVFNTKHCLSSNILKEIHKPSFGAYFSTVLDNCGSCITQSLDLVLELLSETDTIVPRLCGYLDDAVHILRQLAGFITTVIESISMSCCSMQTFPIATGNIIKTVFSHCKDSESIYGSNLKNVEKQLKELFRNCHELQLTYLMVLEKHFIFDLTENDELNILLHALDINLQIGEIVQTLDVKTMAEQWKAYTMICEKHKDYLMDQHIYQNCTKILCSMVEKNIKTALEVQQEEKVILRSLKVGNFTMKILIKVHNIFKHATEKNYNYIVELLLYIYLNNPSYLTFICEKSPQFINLVKSNVLNPSDALLKEMLMEEKFVNHLHNIDLNGLENKDNLLGYVIFIMSAIKSGLQENNTRYNKYKIIDCVFRWLPYGHIWFNMGLKFEAIGEVKCNSFGLYEQLLTHMFVLACTCDSEEINHLQQKIYESILSANCYSALFSSNLLELLVRSSSRSFLMGQISSLTTTYQKLENYQLFADSPQYVHIRYTLRSLYKYLHTEHKIRMYNNQLICDEKNFGLWSAIGIKSLPEELQSRVEEQIVETLKNKLHKVLNSGVQSPDEIESLVKIMNVCATCSLIDHTDTLEDYVIKAWTKMCPNNSKFLLPNGALVMGCVWYLNYIEALVSLTIAMKCILATGANMIKVHHVVSSMIQEGNTEVKLVLIKLFFTMMLTPVCDENKRAVDTLLLSTFKSLFEQNDIVVKNRFFSALRKHISDKNIERIISKVVNENSTLQKTWQTYTKRGTLNENVDLKTQLIGTIDFKYRHKCLESVCMESSDSECVTNKANSSNFDFADIDTLFEAESDSEPACKKVKLDTSDVEEIIARLENDASQLSQVKENVFTRDYKDRVIGVCEMLRNIID
ncbi:uncharacterized protein C1orf112-like isoform X2 [Pectinophora gossypiella]|uniref:uncharacterized protein C1orf112-like isoform X2 n=1 Tax=Pectinophora gossypiella TaxID=13191 RepID=UPI00214DF765|nr:uncharacterized protein C1orf112-like isoform X2 [Pectinophora gossypiella]